MTRYLLPAAFGLVALGLPAGALALAMWPQSPLYGDVRSHGDRDQKLVALTFDDGPNPPATLEVAAALKQAGVQGTFFLVGANVVRHPEVARALVADGDVVGNHSYRHQKRDAIFDLGYDQVAEASTAIHEATGRCPALFRAPNGFHTPWQLHAVSDDGMTAVAWDVQTYDWEDPSPETIVSRVLDQVENGSIILLHDGNDLDSGVDRSSTIAALPLLVDALRSRGYEFVTVDGLLGVPAYAEAC